MDETFIFDVDENVKKVENKAIEIERERERAKEKKREKQKHSKKTPGVK